MRTLEKRKELYWMEQKLRSNDTWIDHDQRVVIRYSSQRLVGRSPTFPVGFPIDSAKHGRFAIYGRHERPPKPLLQMNCHVFLQLELTDDVIEGFPLYPTSRASGVYAAVHSLSDPFSILPFVSYNL